MIKHMTVLAILIAVLYITSEIKLYAGEPALKKSEIMDIINVGKLNNGENGGDFPF